MAYYLKDYKNKGLLRLMIYNRLVFSNSINIIDPRFIKIFKGNIIYEYPVPLIMENLVKKGDIVIDIGAFDGIYTIFLSKLVGKEGKVYAFEPDPGNFSILKHRTKKLNNVIIENKALSDKNGKLRLFLHKYNRGMTSISCREDFIFSIEVECTSLDEYFKDINKEIALIKMDVEGAEFLILRGAKNLVKRVKAIIFEYAPPYLKAANENPKELLNFLISNGFVLFDLGVYGREVKRINDAENFNIFTILLAIKLKL